MRIFKGNKVSSTGFRLAAVAGLAAMLGACHGVELEGLEGVEPQGSEFSMQLFDGYVALSSRELAEYDYRDSDRFAVRAAAAAGGVEVPPTALAERYIPPDKVEEFTKARARLMAMLDGGGRSGATAIAVQAQISFECWMQEQEEGHQPSHISDCRNAFYGSVVAAEVAMRPAAPAPTAAPAPEPDARACAGARAQPCDLLRGVLRVR